MSKYVPSIGETAPMVEREVAVLEQQFENGEVVNTPARCLLSFEIDFNIRPNNGKTTPEQLTALRAGIAEDIALLSPKTNQQAETKMRWQAQIPDLTVPELILYQIHRRLSVPRLEPLPVSAYLQADDSPETTLEYCFGNGIYQTGYYDNPGCFEMRTQAAKPSIALERLKRTVQVARETAEYFGAQFIYRNDQTNFSVWSEEEGKMQPMHSLAYPKGQEVARKAAAGMLTAVCDSLAALHPPSLATEAREHPGEVRVAPERDGHLRLMPSRVEYRHTVSTRDAAGIGHGLIALVLMSGFVYGVTDTPADTSFATLQEETLLAPAEGFQKVKDLHLLRALQNSTVVNGHYEIDARYAKLKGPEVLSSMLGVSVSAYGEYAEYLAKLIECFSPGVEGIEVDEEAFNELMERKAYDVSWYEEPVPITEKLRRIRYVMGTPTIRASMNPFIPTAFTMHDDLARMVTAPSLKWVGREVLELVREERASVFQYEDAVAALCLRETMSYKQWVQGQTATEKVKDISTILAQHPRADRTTTIQVIEKELQKRAANMLYGLEQIKERPYEFSNDKHRINYQRNHTILTELITALHKAFAPNMAAAA